MILCMCTTRRFDFSKQTLYNHKQMFTEKIQVITVRNMIHSVQYGPFTHSYVNGELITHALIGSCESRGLFTSTLAMFHRPCF